MDVKMGNADSTQSTEVGVGLVGVGGSASFHRQAPNVARLIQSENSSKMEYEFPITDGSTNLGPAHRKSSSNSGKRTFQYGNSPNLIHSSSGHSTTSSHDRPPNNSNFRDGFSSRKSNSNAASNLWFSLTSCFGCRNRNSSNSNLNPLRDKVHAIRIVRASNDLTPAVFDSHYNIITLEQLRECDTNTNILVNDLNHQTSSTQNGNTPIGTNSSSNSGTNFSKKDKNHRMRKKKKRRTTTGSEDDDDDDDDDDDNDFDDRSRRT